MHGQNRYLYIRETLADLTRGFDPVQVGHGNVGQNNVRVQFLHQFYQFASIGCLPNHVDVRLGGKQGSDALPDYLMVVPAPGVEWISKSPSSQETRSRIPESPLDLYGA